MKEKINVTRTKSSKDYCAEIHNIRYSGKKKDGELLSSAYFKKFYGFVLAIGFLFVSFGVLFISYAARQGEAETSLFIQRATEQTKFAVEEHIKEEFITLLGAATVAEKQSDLSLENDMIRDVLAVFFRYNTFEVVGFADCNGMAVLLDRYETSYQTDLSGEDFISHALEGHNFMTEARRVEFARNDVNIYSMPIYDEGSYTPRGVLFAANPADELREIVNHSLYAGTGMAHVIDNHGNYVVESKSPLSLGIGNDIFTLSAAMDKKIQEKISGDLAAGKNGYLEVSIGGERRYVAYEPLKINDWFVFYSVSEQLVSVGLKGVTTGAITMIVTAMIFFLFLIMIVHALYNKNRRALETLDFVDALTGQRTYRRFLSDAAEKLNTDGEQYAVCYCDIKGFKDINDLFGRDVGDRLLQFWSDYFCEIMLEDELSGRVSGDIFVYMLKYKTKQEIAARFESTAQRLMVFPETLYYGYRVELYCGVFIADENDSDLSINDRIDRANIALKTVKEEGSANRLGFYSTEMREQKLWEAEVMSKMETALENGEFQLYFQPKIDIQNGDIVTGAEALVRWVSPDHGIVPPNRFIGIFEKNGFITKLDRYIFDKVCQFYHENFSSGDLPACVFSVNVSKLELMQADFIQQYSQIKDKYGIQDKIIELEFTESLVFNNQLLFQSVVTDCKRHGFLCSLDDFGAGYSSLNVLKSIPVDVLKLDRLFFAYGNDEARGRELVRSILSMAKALNMKTVAEGIEQPEQVFQLRKMGCDTVQGYVFAKPMPEKEFVRYLGDI